MNRSSEFDASIEQGVKDYELVSTRRDHCRELIERANDMVRQFIIDRNLILYGGLAIDYALRLKGGQIYPDDEVPDFDFYSPRNIDDAYDLADILFDAGFPNVGVTRGIHTQTVRVRADYTFVADISYIEQEIYDGIPTINYMGIRCRHPHDQIKAIHTALCFPFASPPMEDIYNRLRKDIKRYNMLMLHYPVIGPPIASELKNMTSIFKIPIMSPYTSELRFAFGGFIAYALLRKSLSQLIDALKVTDIRVSAPILNVNFMNKLTVSIDQPHGITNTVVASPWIDEVIANYSKVRHYEAYSDEYPTSAQVDNVIVMSTKNQLLSTFAIQATETMKVLVISPQYLLLWFLVESHRSKNKKLKDIYLAYYVYTIEIINVAEELYADADADPTNAAYHFAQSPFAPITTVIGNVNNSPSFILGNVMSAARAGVEIPAVLNIDPISMDLIEGLPIGYYPDRKKPRPVFDYNLSPLFQSSGKLR
jgi:hypothetical protein